MHKQDDIVTCLRHDVLSMSSPNSCLLPCGVVPVPLAFIFSIFTVNDFLTMDQAYLTLLNNRVVLDMVYFFGCLQQRCVVNVVRAFFGTVVVAF